MTSDDSAVAESAEKSSYLQCHVVVVDCEAGLEL